MNGKLSPILVWLGLAWFGLVWFASVRRPDSPSLQGRAERTAAVRRADTDTDTGLRYRVETRDVGTTGPLFTHFRGSGSWHRACNVSRRTPRHLSKGAHHVFSFAAYCTRISLRLVDLRMRSDGREAGRGRERTVQRQGCARTSCSTRRFTRTHAEGPLPMKRAGTSYGVSPGG